MQREIIQMAHQRVSAGMENVHTRSYTPRKSEIKLSNLFVIVLIHWETSVAVLLSSWHREQQHSNTHTPVAGRAWYRLTTIPNNSSENIPQLIYPTDFSSKKEK